MKKRQSQCYSKVGVTVQKTDSSGSECEKHYYIPQCRKARNDVPKVAMHGPRFNGIHVSQRKF